MSKKHFTALAKSLAYAKPDNGDVLTVNQWKRDVKAVADVCSDSNAQFDYHRFMAACGCE